jgi:methanogenic corrinoid protein MtbC1
VEAFFDAVFRPVMQDIGLRWVEGRIDITTEHVASNVANSVVRMVRDRRAARRGKTGVVLCVPPGEKHHMGCDVLEMYLASRGFAVYNLGYEMPSSEVMVFLERNRPDAVAISASGEYSLLPARKMADKISDTYGIPVILGGYAFRGGDGGIGRHIVCSGTSLKEVPRVIRRAAAGAQ